MLNFILGDFMKMFKSVSMVLGLTGVILSSQVMAKSGNGDSYSGPTLSGNVIVLSLDKPILEEQFQEVFNNCMSKENFLKDFFDNYYKDSKAQYEWKDNSSIIESISGTTLGEKDPEQFLKVSSKFLAVHTSPKRIYRDLIELKVSTNGDLDIYMTKMTQDGRNLQLAVKDFPIFSFSQIEGSLRYDPITGEIIKFDTYFKNLKVIYNHSMKPGYVQAINKSTGQKTQLMAPVGDFTTCMIDKLGSL